MVKQTLWRVENFSSRNELNKFLYTTKDLIIVHKIQIIPLPDCIEDYFYLIYSIWDEGEFDKLFKGLLTDWRIE